LIPLESGEVKGMQLSMLELAARAYLF